MHLGRDDDAPAVQSAYERLGVSRVEVEHVTVLEETENEQNPQDMAPGQEDYDDDYDDEYEAEEHRRSVAYARSSTEPTPLQGYFALRPAKPLHRNRSPLARSHFRSRSSGNLAPPALTRAHSLPAVHSLARSYGMMSIGAVSPSAGSAHSPQRSPARNKSPLSTDQFEGGYFPPRSPHWYENVSGPIESIQEDSELDLTPRPSVAYSPSSSGPPPVSMLPRTSSQRRRPVSPLYNSVAPAFGSTEQESPALAPTKFSDAFPSSFQLHHIPSMSSFSSFSSTPSSARSRSPSISSLETIEDAPDAEYEAIEADRLWRMSLSEKGEREDSGEDAVRRKGFGFGRGRNSERKRWSVCGAERRADLDLETIWED